MPQALRAIYWGGTFILYAIPVTFVSRRSPHPHDALEKRPDHPAFTIADRNSKYSPIKIILAIKFLKHFSQNQITNGESFFPTYQ